VLDDGEPFRAIEIVPDEIGAAKGIAGEITELAVLRIIASVASPRARIDCGDECVSVKPLDRSRLSNSCDRMVRIGWQAWHDTRELRTTALHNSLPVREYGVLRTENGTPLCEATRELRGSAPARSHDLLLHGVCAACVPKDA
jgi:hypothetical protein